MEDRLLAKMAALLEEARAEGAAAGREMARNELKDSVIAMLSAPQPAKRNGHARAARTRIPPPPEAPLPLPQPEQPAGLAAASQASQEWPEHEVEAPPQVARDLVSLVQHALTNMPTSHEGVDPDGLTQFIKLHPNGDADVISVLTVRDVRGALRQMTMTGEVRRIARGRYVAATPPSLFLGGSAA